MIRSSKVSLKFANKNKRQKINDFIEEYSSVMRQVIDLFWNKEKLPVFLYKKDFASINTWLSARAIQCAAKQAFAIIKGTKIKQKRRLFVIDELKKKNKLDQAQKLQKIYDSTTYSKPLLTNVCCQLDSRFIDIYLDGRGGFDGWLTLKSFGKKLKINIPFKKHKHFNKLFEKGALKLGIRLSKTDITFAFELKKPSLTANANKVLGIDIGLKTTLSCSDGQNINSCPHGHTYDSICTKLSKKKKGSKNFKKAVAHRSNYLRYIVNTLDLNGVCVVNREKIKNLRKFTNVSRHMKHWNYAELFDVLDKKLETQGVLVNEINPAFTSQRCSRCGWTCELNRKKKVFKCVKCGFLRDADENASLNLSFILSPLGNGKQLFRDSKNGFYWTEVSKEPIVPNVQKTDFHERQ